MPAQDQVSRPGGDALLSAALGSMPYGFSIWDEALNLVLCNDAYVELYNFDPKAIRPGLSLMEVCRLTVALGNHPGVSAEELHAAHLARFEATRAPGSVMVHQKQLRGRVIKTSHIRSVGLGWTVIHEDITAEAAEQQRSDDREAALNEQNIRFEAALGHMSQGLSMFDADSKLLICNERYRQIYDLPLALCVAGTPLEEILAYREADGAVFLGTGDDLVERVLDEASRTQNRVATYRLRNGRVISVTKAMMTNGGFLTTHQDITLEIERFAAMAASEAVLAKQNMRFEAAVNNMGQGLCLFDKDERLVICNASYAALYSLPPELTAPGARHADIVAYRTAHGMRPVKGVESFMSQHWRLRHDEASRVVQVELADGRLISIHHQPMEDGGWVSTHQDVTEDNRRLAAIEASERELKVQNLRFDAAVNNMSQGLCMFDKDERLVVCNTPYARIYNLPSELMAAGTTLTQILDYRFAHGMVPKQGREQYVTGRKALVTDAIDARDEIEMEDGRTILIQHHPMTDGGWVATHEDVTEQRRNEARIRHLARHDGLTDLPNRVLFREHMEKAEARMKRNEVMAVLCIDLDHFKAVNDTLGHSFGDAVLSGVARRLRGSIRESDVVARLGGDEFAVLAGPLEGPRDVAAIAEKIVRSVGEPFEIEGHQIMVGASVGIAVAPGDGVDAETLLKNADLALYRAKNEGRGRFHFFEKGMDEAMQNRRALESGLKVALLNKQFRLVFQPLLNLSDNRICCLEALLRWDHPERGLVSPAEFIPIAEETGVIVPIGEWVLREACKTAAAWPDDIRIAVNLSPIQFRHRGLVEIVKSALSEADLDPTRLELEITESLLLAETEQTLKILHDLKAIGIRISMDDFGTGYSSLSYLRSFPFDKIKIDRSFMRESSPNEESVAIIKAVIGLGQSLGMSTTAEGIETEEQLAAVRAQGCDEVQGFLFSPPLPASSIAALLATMQPSAAVPKPNQRAQASSGTES